MQANDHKEMCTVNNAILKTKVIIQGGSPGHGLVLIDFTFDADHDVSCNSSVRTFNQIILGKNPMLEGGCSKLTLHC